MFLFIYSISFTGSSCNTLLYTSSQKHYSRENYTEYTCLICKYSTCHLNDIKIHVRFHTGERPFKCNFCKKSFNEKSDLKNHLIYIHDKKF